MKFYVKLCLQNANVAAELIRNLFKDINPESSIYIKGNSAVMEIVFEKEPNSELMEAISECELKELKFNFTEVVENTSINSALNSASNVGVISNENEVAEAAVENVEKVEFKEPAEETVDEEVETNDSVEALATEEAEEVETEDSAEDQASEEIKEVEPNDVDSVSQNDDANVEENADTENANVVKKRKYNCSKGNEDYTTYLQELAGKATSFNEFIVAVCNWLNLEKDKTEYFTKLLNKFLEADNPEMAITTKGIEAITLNLGYTLGMKNVLGRCITKKLIEINSGGTLIPFLKNVIKFRVNFTTTFEKNETSDFSNDANSKEEPNDSDEEDHIKVKKEEPKILSSDESNKNLVEIAKPEPLTKIPGFPTIPKFEEFLRNLDFSNSVRGVVVEILNSMGVDELPQWLKEKLTNVCVFAALTDPSEVDYKDCFRKANIFYDSTEGNELRMEIAKFVNSFISFAYSGRYSSVTTQVFLKGISEFIKSHEQTND